MPAPRRPHGILLLATAALLLLTTALLLLPPGVDASSTRDDGRVRRLYEEWAQEHGKAFEDEAAWETGLRQFEKTEAFIEGFNNARSSSSPSFTLRHSRFSGMTEAEVAAFFWRPDSGFLDAAARMSEEEEAEMVRLNHERLGATAPPLGGKLPDRVDWSTTANPLGRSIVTPPINQGHCGGCWSIVSASVVESAVALRHGVLTPLSAQELLDCDTAWNAGCLGGNPIQSFDFIRDYGLATADSYPYRAQQLPCRREEVAAVSSIESYRILRSYDEGILLHAVARQPVAVGVAGQHPSFLYYGGGIYDDEACGTELNHALVLVGYGTDEATGQEYWIAKNSWGTGWGEGGYVRLARGKNLCGLATAPSIPLGAYGGNATALLEARGRQDPSSPAAAAAPTDSGAPSSTDDDIPTNRPFDLPDWLQRSLPGLAALVVLLAVGTYFFGRPTTAAVERGTAAGYTAQPQRPYQQSGRGGAVYYQPVGTGGSESPAAVDGAAAGASGGGGSSSRYGAV